MPYALEILRLEICFAILIPWPEKEQIHAALGIKNPKSSKELGLEKIVLSGFMMVSLFQAFPSWMG